MTYLALRFSGYVNGVAMRHGEVSRGMFPAYDISAITNGVHAMTWTSPAFCELFDSYIPGWRADNNFFGASVNVCFSLCRIDKQSGRFNYRLDA